MRVINSYLCCDNVPANLQDTATSLLILRKNYIRNNHNALLLFARCYERRLLTFGADGARIARDAALLEHARNKRKSKRDTAPPKKLTREMLLLGWQRRAHEADPWLDLPVVPDTLVADNDADVPCAQSLHGLTEAIIKRCFRPRDCDPNAGGRGPAPIFSASGVSMMCDFAHNMLLYVVPRIVAHMASNEHANDAVHALEADVAKRVDCAIVKAFEEYDDELWPDS